jgi:hypothetical protein
MAIEQLCTAPSPPAEQVNGWIQTVEHNIFSPWRIAIYEFDDSYLKDSKIDIVRVNIMYNLSLHHHGLNSGSPRS